MKPPIALFPGNDSELQMSEAQFLALPQAALTVLVRHRCQRWEWRRRVGTETVRTSGRDYEGPVWEYLVTIYMPAAALPELLAVCRPGLGR